MRVRGKGIYSWRLAWATENVRPTSTRQDKTKTQGLGTCSVGQNLPSVCKTLGVSLITTNKRRKRRRRRKGRGGGQRGERRGKRE